MKPILLVDGLEKKRGEKLKAAARFVTELGRLECSLVLVAPLGLAFLPEYSNEIGEWDRIVTLPAVSLRSREGSLQEAGYRVLESVLEQRVSEEIFDLGAKQLLVTQSAGIHRTVLMLAQDACLNAISRGSSSISEDSVEEAIEERRLEMSGFLTPGYLKMLASVRKTKLINSFADALPLLERNAIVAYQNSTTWFDVHSLVGPLVDTYEGVEVNS